VRGGGHEVGMRHRVRVFASGDQTGVVGHIDHKVSANLLGNRGHAFPIKTQGVSRSATDQELGLVLNGNAFHLVVIDFFFFVQAVRHDIKELARQIGRRAVGQVTAVPQVHAHHGIARFQKSEVHRLVGLRTGMRLHVDVFSAEDLLQAIDRQLLDHVDMLATTVETLARITFGVLVGELGALGFHHSSGNVIFRSDQLDVIFLTDTLGSHGGGEFGIVLGDGQGLGIHGVETLAWLENARF